MSSSGSRYVPLCRSLIFGSVALLGACGGGGGPSSSSFDRSASLQTITFPDPTGVNPEATDSPPQNAPLVQQVVFTFNGRPDPNRVSTTTVQVRDENNLPVDGTFTVSGSTITFTPTLP